MKVNKFIFVLVFSLLFSSFLVGCSSDEKGAEDTEQQANEEKKMVPPDQPPDLNAEVESQTGNKILVVDRVGDDQNQAVTTVQVELNVKPSTQFLIREGENKYRQGKVEDLKKGTKVEVWYKSVVVDGDPLIADGECIVYEKP